MTYAKFKFAIKCNVLVIIMWGVKILNGIFYVLISIGFKYVSKFPLCWFLDELPVILRFVMATMVISTIIYYTIYKKRIGDISQDLMNSSDISCSSRETFT